MPEGSTVWVAGWGTTSSGGNTSEDLLKVSVNVSYPSQLRGELRLLCI